MRSQDTMYLTFGSEEVSSRETWMMQVGYLDWCMIPRASSGPYLIVLEFVLVTLYVDNYTLG